MNEAFTAPTTIPDGGQSSLSKWEYEYLEFERLLPQLMLEYKGKYVAIHDGTVVDSDNDKIVLALRVLTKIGNLAIHIGQVSEETEVVAHSGIRREVRPERKP